MADCLDNNRTTSAKGISPIIYCTGYNTVIKFVSDLRQVGGFLRDTGFFHQ